MLVICSNCEARLQLDENKTPSQPFKVRCPKCHSGIDVQPGGSSAESALTVSVAAEMASPAPSPFQRPASAKQFKPTAKGAGASSLGATMDASEVAKLLASALRQSDADAPKMRADKMRGWDPRKALVCTSPDYREAVANGLVANDYDVFVAENTAEALGRMREDRIDVLILESNFDSVEQGFAFVTREIRLMRPPERRRLFVVCITPGARTMDLHAAFLHHVNLVVNPADVDHLADALEVSISHFNELYRGFNRALDIPAI